VVQAISTNFVLFFTLLKKKNINSRQSPTRITKRWTIWAGLSLVLPVCLIFSYNRASESLVFFGWELKKIGGQEETNDVPLEGMELFYEGDHSLLVELEQKSGTASRDSLQQQDAKDSKKQPSTVSSQGSSDAEESISYDVTGEKQRILLMGDSECGGLCYPLNDYCRANGHELVATLVWNSAGIYNFAYADTVEKIIRKYKPTYIFIALGLNELYVRDITRRKKAAAVLAKKIEGIPYTWVGPANYMEDFGINNAFKQAAQPGAFYLTKQLTLPKGGDKRHPNKQGYRIWMDSLAIWVSNSAKHSLPLQPPAKRNRPLTGKIISLNAARYRGY
jgi:hypothetical protein